MDQLPCVAPAMSLTLRFVTQSTSTSSNHPSPFPLLHLFSISNCPNQPLFKWMGKETITSSPHSMVVLIFVRWKWRLSKQPFLTSPTKMVPMLYPPLDLPSKAPSPILLKSVIGSKSKFFAKVKRQSVMPFSNPYAQAILLIPIPLSRLFINWSKTQRQSWAAFHQPVRCEFHGGTSTMHFW